jgi:glycosyltransferase involved in cell wall biosynthesis
MRNQFPEISVIITTYNRANYLKEAIISVLNQTYQDFEIIVVDDGSKDNTPQVIQSITDPRIKYISQKNQGVGAARNTGTLASAGKMVALLDADDLWLPEKLELQIKALESSPQASIVYCDMYFFGLSEIGLPITFFQLLNWPAPRGNVLDKMVTRSFGHPSTLLVKKEVFDKIGLFDEKLPYCDDYDMLIRMAAYFQFEVVPSPLVKYRLHSDQISKNTELVLRDHLIVFNKALQLPVINNIVRESLNVRLADFHFQYAILLVRRHKVFKGLKEFSASLRTNSRTTLISSLSLVKRSIYYLHRRIITKPPVIK